MKAHMTKPRTARGRSSALTEVDRLKREAESLRSRLAKLNEASLGIAGSLEIDKVLQAIIDASRLLTGARYGAILTFDDSGGLEHFFVSGITPEQRRRMDYTPQGLGILGYLSEVEGPLRLSEIAAHPRSIGFPENHPPMKSFLGISMRHEGKHIGNIYLTEKEGGGDFTAEDEESLTMFASQGAASIANSRAHRAATSARADLEALLDISPVAVLVFDAKTRDLLSLNPEARRIIHDVQAPGRSMKAILGVLTLRRPNGQDIPLDELPTERAISTGETVRAEEIVLHLPDGKAIRVLCNAAPIRGENGEIVSVAVTLQDLTPLEDLERVRAEFLDIVGNELRNPLTSIKGAVTTVLNSSFALDPVDTRQYIRIVDQQVDRMSTLVGNLLDVSRVETGTLSLNTGPVDLSDLFQEARRTFLARGARTIITIDTPPRLPMVIADRRRIMQVLVNLLSNASVHSPDWSEVTVSASVDDLHVVVSVADEGAGIAPERLPHIFRKYSGFEHQHFDDGGTPSTNENLALAISRGIIETHGGRIWAESEGLGFGATFSFTIPVTDERVSAPATPSLAPAPPPGPRRGVNVQEKVLVVDSERRMLRLVHGSLLEAGYASITTGDPADVVHLVKTQSPDLAVLNRTLDIAEGVELIRRVVDVSAIPVIVMSDRDGDEFITQAFQAGAEDYIVKPFSPEELVARIKALLRKRAALVQTRSETPFVLGEMTIDYAESRVSMGGRRVQLTPTEYRLLRELSKNAGNVLTHGHLLRRIWGDDHSEDTQVVRTFVKNLRRKLGDRANSPTYILTVPPMGYRMPRP